MAINYPGSPDTFTVPTNPEFTSLSSAGSGTRNHTQSIKDQGLAITALENNAAKKAHDHGGDAADTAHGGKLLQANTHQSADTDAAVGSIHHTIDPTGLSPTAAAAANHNHVYGNLIGIPHKICTSLTRPPDPTPGMTIYETDTRRARIWDTFANNVAITGLYAVDYFNRVSTTDIGTSLWEIAYDLTPTSNGRAATPDGNTMSWADGGVATNRLIARRINNADKETQTDDQVVTWQTGNTLIEWEFPFIGDGALNDAYLRMSADKNSYIRIKVGYNYLKVFYTTTGKANEAFLGQIQNVNTVIANQQWRAQVQDRTITIYRNGEPLGMIVDDKAVTAKGPTYRGWGIGMVAGQWGFGGQSTPANVDWVSIQDLIHYGTTNRWTLLPIVSRPSCRLRQGKTQKLLTTGTILEWATEVEDNFDYFDVRAPSSVLIREPGLYRLDATLQWDPQVVPDVGHVIAMINGVETNVRDSKVLRGNALAPGFSQTLSLSAPLRFAENDVLQIKAKYTATNNILDLIFSWFDLASKVDSRLDLTYVSP